MLASAVGGVGNPNGPGLMRAPSGSLDAYGATAPHGTAKLLASLPNGPQPPVGTPAAASTAAPGTGPAAEQLATLISALPDNVVNSLVNLLQSVHVQ